MKTGIIGLMALLALLIAAPVMAADYGYMGGGYVTPMQEKSQIAPSNSVAFTGTLALLNGESHELLVNTTVPGLLGPVEKTIPFKVGEDTTVTVCFKSLNSCETVGAGSEGWDRLARFEQISPLSDARRDVVVVGDPNSDRIVHIQIKYEI